MRFKSEKQMCMVALNSQELVPLVNPTGDSYYLQLELAGYFGVPDIIIAQINKSGQLQTTALELKLSNWQKALSQAFRYRAFANCAYVIIDHDKVSAPLKNVELFRKANIGLLSINTSGKVYLHCRSSFNQPYSTHLSSQFEYKIQTSISKKFQIAHKYNELSMLKECTMQDLLAGIFVSKSVVSFA